MEPSLSVVLVVRDAEALVGDALSSVEGLADDVVVLDTGSVDGTLELVRRHAGARVFESEFDGFGAVKQRALEQARGAWVLSLDADERLSPELAARLRRLEADGDLERHDAYRIRRRTWIQGRAMRSMGLGDELQLRLFRREGARFDDRLVHEGVVLPAAARIGTLPEPIEHYTLTSIDAYLRKIDLYTTLEHRENPRHPSVGHLVVTWPSTFLRFYVARGGWRDGWPGLLWAGLTAAGAFFRDMKAWIEGGAGDEGAPPRREP